MKLFYVRENEKEVLNLNPSTGMVDQVANIKT